MTTFTHEDLDRIGANLIRAGELLRDRGGRAMTRASQVSSGAMRAGALGQIGRSGPSDPTATQGTGNTKRMTDESRTAFMLNTAVQLADRAALAVRNDILRLVPENVPRDEQCPEGWCRSCYRDGGHLEPEHTHRDGTVKHRGLCWWCAGFQADYEQLPTVEVVRLKHQSRRVTQSAIERLMPYLKDKKPKEATAESTTISRPT